MNTPTDTIRADYIYQDLPGARESLGRAAQWRSPLAFLPEPARSAWAGLYGFQPIAGLLPPALSLADAAFELARLGIRVATVEIWGAEL